jgi:hypothetical protein
MRKAFGVGIKVASLTDNDYELSNLPAVGPSDTGDTLFLHLQRKEIENYLIDPPSVAAAAASAAQLRSQHNNIVEVQTPSEDDIRAQLNLIFESSEIKDLMRYQILPRYRETLDAKLATATREAQAEDWFNERWSDFDWKLRNSPGKKVLALLRTWCQSKYTLTVTTSQILKQIAQVPPDFEEIRNSLQKFFA